MKYVNIIICLLAVLLIISCSSSKVFSEEESEDADLLKVYYTESAEVITNPERGFYKHFSFSSSNSDVLSPVTVEMQRKRGVTLLLTIYYLNDFRDKPISEDFLARLATNMEALRKGGSKCVLRFAYSSSEADKPWDAPQLLVLDHIKQLSPYLSEYSDVIYVMEAGFVGVWGEWYYTTHFNMNPSTEEEFAPRTSVIAALLAALPKDRMVSVRTPAFKLKAFNINYTDTVTRITAHNGSYLSRVASHNDCFLASADDVGTFSNADERSFWESESKYQIMGGETCGVSDYSSCRNAINQMEKYHWSYLNSDYHRAVLNSWEEEGCMDVIDKRLGYRLVLTEGRFTKKARANKSFEIELSIINRGFAAPMNPRNVEIVFVSKEDPTMEYKFSLDDDPRFWFAGEEHSLSFATVLPNEWKGRSFDIFINLSDPKATLRDKPEFSIQLANDKVWSPERGYNCIHTVNVL